MLFQVHQDGAVGVAAQEGEVVNPQDPRDRPSDQISPTQRAQNGVSAGWYSHSTSEPGSGPTAKSEADVFETAGEAQRALSVQGDEVGETLDEGAPRTTGISAGEAPGVAGETDDILADRQVTR
jgi:hypothetical protein